MNRESVSKEILKLSKKHKNMLIQLPTGFGKSKVALDYIQEHHKHPKTKVLIVVPRNVLKNNWGEEIEKWNMNKSYIEYTYTTYVSLPKYAGHWDIIVCDECHHLSERCREALTNFTFDRSILLSATVKPSMLDELNEVFSNLFNYKIKVKDAIENEVLPDPKVYLMPLYLDKDFPTEAIYKNPKGALPMMDVNWADRWAAIRQKRFKVRIFCTELQYYQDLDSQIEWFKNKYMRTRNDIFKNRWLRLAGERLKWLSDKKLNTIKSIKERLNKERCLIFCNSIEQTEVMGNCINSKNKDSINTLAKFNEGTINQISCVNMLNEGCNLNNCRIGVWGVMNSSEIMIIQKIGRLLRHKSPVLIIPYYKNTREEEIVQKMIENYNPKLIKKITNVKELKL